MDISIDRLIAEAASEGPHQGETFFKLGMAYAAGHHVDVDYVQAHKWFNLAVMKGHREAVQHRNELANEMNFAQIAEALRMAREWLARPTAEPYHATA